MITFRDSSIDGTVIIVHPSDWFEDGSSERCVLVLASGNSTKRLLTRSRPTPASSSSTADLYACPAIAPCSSVLFGSRRNCGNVHHWSCRQCKIERQSRQFESEQKPSLPVSSTLHSHEQSIPRIASR